MGIDEIYKALVGTNNLVVVGSALAAILVFISWKLSLFTPNKKEKLESKIDGAKEDLLNNLHDSYERQFELTNNRITAMDARILAQGDMIHRQQVRLTRLQVLVIQLKGHLQNSGVEIPLHLEKEIITLTEEQ